MAVTRVRPGTTATPPGMEGVRPRPPRAPRPPSAPRPLRRPGGAPMAVSFNPDGTTTLKPPPAAPRAAAAPAAPPPPVAPATPTTPFNYADALLADYRYAPGMAGITQSQLGIGEKYGSYLNRDAKGMVMYRVPGTEPGAGNISARVDPVTGTFTYVDPSGKEYKVTELEIDVVPIKRGQAGYLLGAFGQTAAGSEKQQFAIGDTAAQAGLRRSGMRASSSAMESQALQNALRNLSIGQGQDYLGTTARYADLLNTIFPDLVKKAGEYETPPVETPAAPEAPAPEAAAPAAPEYAGYNAPVPGNPTSGPLTPGPGGQFMTMIGNVTLERNTNDAAIREGLRAFLRNPAYQLTPQQIRYINSLITGRYKGNKKY